MNITDEQFITAMESVVAQRGGEHYADATYWNDYSMMPDCIIGCALWEIDSRLCPRSNKDMADVVLLSLGCSARVANAAYAAQHLNDAKMPWRFVLDGFRFALALPVGLPAHEVAYRTRMETIRRRALLSASAPKVEVSAATITGLNVQWSLDMLTTLNTLYAPALSGSSLFSEETFAFANSKKDHALVA